MKRAFTINILCFMVKLALGQDTTTIKLKCTYTKHNRNVESVAFTPDGTKVLFGDNNGDIRVYAVDSILKDSVITTIRGHLSGVSLLQFSKDGSLLASAAKDYAIRINKFPSGEVIFTSQDNKDAVTQISFDSKNENITVSSADGTLRFYNIVDLKKNEKPKFIKHTGAIYAFANGPAPRTFYIAGAKTNVEAIDAMGKVNPAIKFEGHAGAIESMLISPDGKKLATASRDKKIMIWDLTTKKLLYTFVGHTFKITSISWNWDSKYLASSGNDGETFIWNVEEGKRFKTIFTPAGTNARQVAISPKGNFVAIAIHRPSPYGGYMYALPFAKVVVKPKPKTDPKKPTTGTSDKKPK